MEDFLMKRLFTVLLSVLAVFALTACGSDAGKAALKTDNAPPQKSAEEAKLPSGDANNAKGKILVAYFSCTGNTKALAEKAAKALSADVYEIVPESPYTAEDLNYNDETTRATAEQKDDSARPALADNNAGIEGYDTIVLAYPIWWGQAPRIMDTFVESYDFAGKTIVPICTSGGSDIGSSADYLAKLMHGQANWKNGRRFATSASENEVKEWLSGLGL